MATSGTLTPLIQHSLQGQRLQVPDSRPMNCVSVQFLQQHSLQGERWEVPHSRPMNCASVQSLHK
eukprot:1157555-Pelagomonas_calceolata.AAC.3